MLKNRLLSKVLPLAAVLSCLIQSVFSANRLNDVVAIKVDRRNAHQNERTVLKAVLRHDGSQTILTNSVVELKTGRNRFDESLRQWVEADDSVELMDGAAVGLGTAHKTIFSANLNDPEGTIDLLTLDKKRMRSQVVGVAYTERNTGRSVFIAEIIDSTGELQDRNSIVYPRAFDAINADIRYRHSLAGLEQDVIFREELPIPEEFDLDSKETYLEIWTHFLETPDPEKTRNSIHRHHEKTQHDETLNFGEMEIIAGRAFDTGQEDQNVGILVAKEWVKIEGMTFLIESVPVIDVAKRLSALPKRAVARKTVDKLDVLRNANRGSNRLVAVRRKPASLKPHKTTNITPEARKHLIAKSINQTPAGLFLIDYTLVSTTPNFTFRADTTYYVSGPVTLSGTTAFEGGTVIKYDNTATTKLEVVS